MAHQEDSPAQASVATIDDELRRLLRLSCELQAKQLMLTSTLLERVGTVSSAERFTSPSFWGMFALGACAGLVPIVAALIATNRLPC